MLAAHEGDTVGQDVSSLPFRRAVDSIRASAQVQDVVVLQDHDFFRVFHKGRRVGRDEAL